LEEKKAKKAKRTTWLNKFVPMKIQRTPQKNDHKKPPITPI
jgi:hypothetical protein